MATETTLVLQQIICPSCKRPINTFNPNKLMTECPFCHSKHVNLLVNRKDVPMPERIIPFTTNEQTFENALVNTLVNQDYVPTDVFDSISAGDVIQTYLPMYLFEGTYNASWSCESSYTDQKVSVGNNIFDGSQSVSTKNVKKWRPQNGSAAGNFAFLCLANEGNDLPEELRQFTRLFPYDVLMSKEFEPDMIDYEDDNLMTLERNADVQLVWQKHGKDMVEETAKNSALFQLGKQEIRNFRASSSYTLTTPGRFVLAPFWFVYYNYGGEQYYFLMDGIGERAEYSYPINQEEVKFVHEKENIAKYAGWAWPISIVMWFLFDFYTGIITLMAWLIAAIVVKNIMQNKIRQRLDESKTKRKEGADRI